MHKIITVAVLLSWSANALAQGRVPVLIAQPAARPDDKHSPQPLRLSALKVEAQVFGFIAETRMTMTFYNPHHRPLEGDLYFPLPEGATVSGYALDVRGVMVDGVVVEKQKARVVFEKEVRKGIDPGLVQWVKGNNFHTRVFPIPAMGRRTIMVRYVSELTVDQNGATYQLPLAFGGPIDRFTLRLNVLGRGPKPRIAWSGPSPLVVKRQRSGFFSETELENATLKGRLDVTIPSTHAPEVLVERSPQNEVHFCLSDFPIAPRTAAADSRTNKGLSRIRLLWDASASRAQADHTGEIALIRALFGKYRHQTVSVDLVAFRNAADKTRTFVVKNGNVDALIGALHNIDYDGGTQLAAIEPSRNGAAADFLLLFSDGISNFGRAWPRGLHAPVYAFSSDPTANHLLLRRLAHATGGEYFNLARITPAAAVARIGVPSYAFISARISDGKIDLAQLVPSTGQPVHGHFTVAGKLLGKRATVVLSYGLMGQVLATRTFRISLDDAVDGDLIARFWAQKKVNELAMFPRRNARQLVVLGKRYGLVTPGTALMVLETLQQYIEHQIEPPRSLPELYASYQREMRGRALLKERQQQDKLEAVLSLWRKHVDWWKRAFKYPSDFRYRAVSHAAHNREGVGLGGEGRGSAAGHGRLRMEATRNVSAESDLRESEDRAPDRVAAAAPAKRKAAIAYRGTPQPAIALAPWDPKTPYIIAIKQAPARLQYAVYLQQKQHYGQSPAFYLDSADFFLRTKRQRIGLRILSNVAEMELENAPLLRILAHRLAQLGKLTLARSSFEEVLRLRPEEPQSYRDLALVLARQHHYARAMKLLAHVVMTRWDRFDEIEVIALVELNALLPRARAAGIKNTPIDPRLIKQLPVDVRIVLSWDADLTDIDLWVIEPSGEKAYYGHSLTTIGGLVSRDFTQGYGPETYNIKKAMRGTYKVQVNFFGSRAQKLSGAVTLYLDLYTNYGRPNQRRKSVTLRLTKRKETITVGTLKF